MKGIIFVEFLGMVDEKLGMEVTEEIVEKSNLPSKGHYTTVGTYDDAEMISLVTELHKKTEIPVPELLKTFGLYLFGSFAVRYKDMIHHISDSFEMLRKIENYIHVEVKKMYKEAVLPTFSYEDISENKLKLIYTSERKMPDLAEGLIEATLTHFEEKFTITRTAIKEDNSQVEFLIERF